MQVLISCFLDTGIFLWFNGKYEKKLNPGLNLLIVLFSMIIFTEMMNTLGINKLVPRILISSIYYFSMFILIYKERCITGIKRSVELMSCVMLAEFSTSIILMIFQENTNIEKLMNDILFWLIFMGITRSVEILFMYLINNISFSYKDLLKKVGGIIGILLMILGYLYFVLYCFMQNEIDYTMLAITFLINIIFVYLIFFGYFILLKYVRQNELQKKEMELLEEKTELQIEYFEQINQYKMQMKKVYHDIKNHMLVADAIQEVEAKEKYAQSLKEYFDSLDLKINSGNEILDLLIEKKKKECVLKDIIFEYDLDFSKGNFVNLVDVCVIFGNILDNAIDATKEFEFSKRKIHLFVGSYADFIVIKLKNPAKKIIEKKGKLITSKSEKNKHGIGLVSLEDSLIKYEGTYIYDFSNEEFVITIMIPFKQ